MDFCSVIPLDLFGWAIFFFQWVSRIFGILNNYISIPVYEKGSIPSEDDYPFGFYFIAVYSLNRFVYCCF